MNHHIAILEHGLSVEDALDTIEAMTTDINRLVKHAREQAKKEQDEAIEEAFDEASCD